MAESRVALSWVSVSSGAEAEEGDLVTLLSNPRGRELFLDCNGCPNHST